MTATDQLRIGFLGELTVSSGGEVLDLGGRRQRAVLALLLLARGEVVRADHLVESLWGTAAGQRRRGAAVLRVAPAAAPAAGHRRTGAVRRDRE